MTVASLYYSALRTFGVPAARRRRQRAGLILCYHNVVAREPEQGETSLHLPRDRFERQMRWLAAHYEVVPLTEVVRRLTRGTSLSQTAAITFDDGYAGVFEHAVPVLRSMKLPATVFVVAEAPGTQSGFWWDEPRIAMSVTAQQRERWLTDFHGDGGAILSQVGGRTAAEAPPTHQASDWRTIKAALGDGIDIGVHSATHRSLNDLSDRELEHEIVDSRAITRLATGIDPHLFAYPYGLSTPRVRARVRAAGYRAAFSLGAQLVTNDADRWGVPRLNIPAAISDAAFEAWTAGIHGRRPS
jgi:peptidoglycan/xylan/chitin deacetylase (PgdA/CDA1 family)